MSPATAALQRAAQRFAIEPIDIAPRPRGTLVAYDGLMLEVMGLTLPVGSVCKVETATGGQLDAEVVGFRGPRLTLMSYAGATDLLPGARVAPARGGALVPVGDDLLGRVIDGAGQPLDGGTPARGGVLVPLAGAAGNPLDRTPVRAAVTTGVRAIDALTTLGRGQRIGLIAGSGIGKSVLMGMIARHAEADAVVVALIGERGREVSDFVETKLPSDLRARACVVAVPADHAPVLRIRGAMRATAVAEEMRARGRHVLLLMDSLTRVAHAQRELGLALGEPASARGYPPSAIALLARLVERAGGSTASGGAITAIYTVLADGDDAQDPVVDAARAILDGHVLLDRTLAERGLYPAINPARSLSRCMADIVGADQLAAARRLRRLFATDEDNRDLVAMGAYKAGADPELDEAFARRDEIRAFLAQMPDEPAGDATARLVAAFGR